MHDQAQIRWDYVVVGAGSPDTDAAVVIERELLHDSGDIEKLTAACRQVREIFASEVFTAFRLGERLPGLDVQTDTQWA